MFDKPERWQCMGVGKNKPHVLPPSEQPDQPTTDAAGRYRYGMCPSCKKRTVWRKFDGSPLDL